MDMDVLPHDHSLSNVHFQGTSRGDRPRSDIHVVKFCNTEHAQNMAEQTEKPYSATRLSGSLKLHLPRASSEKNTSTPAGGRKDEIKRTRTNRILSETSGSLAKSDFTSMLRQSGRKSQSSISADDVVEDAHSGVPSTLISPVISLKRLTGTVSPQPAMGPDFSEVNSIQDFEVSHVEFIRGKSLKERDQSQNRFMFSRFMSRGRKSMVHAQSQNNQQQQQQ